MKAPQPWMRGILLAGAMALLLSCGGGGGGGSAGGLGVGGGTAASVGGDSTGAGGSTGTADGGGGGDGGSSGTGTGTGTGGGGSGDGTSTAGNGTGDGSGVGSGGTGVSADAGIGSVGGIGSVILNGVRYNTDTANRSIEDTTELQIGMSVRIAGDIDSEFTTATAQSVTSAAELRGAISAINLASGSFMVMGTAVSTDNATVWGDAAGLAQAVDGTTVQVWGLPSAPGTLRATRVELRPALSEPLATGAVSSLDRIGKTFTLGGLTVRYAGAAFSGGIDESTLADGAIVRVRGATAPVLGIFDASRVQGWYAVPKQNAAAVQLAGVVTDYAGLGSFRLLGTPVDASGALVTGGLPSSVGNGVKVEVDGIMTGGVLVAKKLRIRNIPGVGGPVDFTLIGAIGSYQSASNFMVQGRAVNAGGPFTVFENGTVADLGNGRRVSVVGDAVVQGVLIARRVSFEQPSTGRR
ncbi:hypothetical protein M2165_004257 [Variovorax sp. TBS-050B]|uniref:DUF5666 domain-containing protein n=1 Tax=Variovorax sp. TBS-050B TaxID=2940551 RepID=UPI0024740B84|nr:DUF5666 domain-containing protein [Variovorax sp. TBS-050B]MDH6594368.1 hypothetical protein [Variovorax sp. TBS-050B]